MSNRKFIVPTIFSIILLLSLFLRLRGISSFPFDFDEGIHGYVSYFLYQDGIYAYSYSHHGPFLYYVTAAAFHLFGDSIFVARAVAVLFGVSMIVLLYPMRRHFGNVAFLITSALFAFSPSFVRLSQVARNDIYLSFFTLATVICLLLYLEKRKMIYLLLSSSSFALSFTVKENAYITLLIFASFVFFYYLHRIFTREKGPEAIKLVIGGILQNLKKNRLALFLSAMMFLITYTLIFTFFFKDLAGFARSFDAIRYWLDATYSYGFYNPGLYQPPLYYVEYLIKNEFPIFVLGMVGGLYYLFGKNNRFMKFATYWAFASLLVYSSMPYKAGRLTLNILLPFIIVAGVFLGELFVYLVSRKESRNRKDEKSSKFKIVVAVLLVLWLGGYYAHALSGISYGGDPEWSELRQFVKDVTSEDYGNTIIIFVNPNADRVAGQHWPLPWYVREYAQKGLSEIPNLSSSELAGGVELAGCPIFIVSQDDFEYFQRLESPLELLGYERRTFDSIGLLIYYRK